MGKTFLRQLTVKLFLFLAESSKGVLDIGLGDQHRMVILRMNLARCCQRLSAVTQSCLEVAARLGNNGPSVVVVYPGFAVGGAAQIEQLSHSVDKGAGSLQVIFAQPF